MGTRKSSNAEPTVADLDNMPLGALADLYYLKREERLEAQRKADEIEKFEKSVKETIINRLPKSEANGVAGKLCRVQVKTKEIPQVRDWEKLHAYIIKNAKKGAFALLQRRVNEATVNEIWEEGGELPGVEKFTTVTLSVNKL